MKSILGTALLAMAIPASACFAPRGGPEIDALIEVEALEEINQYSVSVPSSLEPGLRKAEISLAYSEHESGGIPIYEPVEVLMLESKGGRSMASFAVKDKRPMRPYIVVMWWHEKYGRCGVQANSGFIPVK